MTIRILSHLMSLNVSLEEQVGIERETKHQSSQKEWHVVGSKRVSQVPNVEGF